MLCALNQRYDCIGLLWPQWIKDKRLMENNRKACALNLYGIILIIAFNPITYGYRVINTVQPQAVFMFCFFFSMYLQADMGIFLFCHTVADAYVWGGSRVGRRQRRLTDRRLRVMDGSPVMCAHMWCWNGLSVRLLSFNHVERQDQLYSRGHFPPVLGGLARAKKEENLKKSYWL